MANPKAPTHEEARAIVLHKLAADGDNAAGLLAYIAAACRIELERDSFKDRAEYERRISDQCLRERDLAEARQKLAESTKDAESAKWEIAFREELARREKAERVAAVLREHGRHILKALGRECRGCAECEEAAKSVEEALTSPSPPAAPAPPNSSTGSRAPE